MFYCMEMMLYAILLINNRYCNVKLLQKILGKQKRSKDVVKNVLASIVLKGADIIISLLLVPLTINYLDVESYGIWLTLSSIVVWISYFDFGLGNGFRNKYAEALALGDKSLARSYLSTSYFSLFVIFTIVFLIVGIANNLINWTELLSVRSEMLPTLRSVFLLLSLFFCIRTALGVFESMLQAKQKPAGANFIQVIGHALSLFSIWLLTLMSHGDLILATTFLSGIPCLTLLIFTLLFFWHPRYRNMSPKLSCIDLGLIKDIVGLGGQFFLIMLSVVLIFQCLNIVISNIQGPSAVAEFNVAQRYFGVVHMVFTIIVVPFWSAFTDAYAKRDYKWMKTSQKKLEMILILCITSLIVMYFGADLIIDIWTNGKISVHHNLSFMLVAFTFSQSVSSLYMTLINGIGKIRLQLVIYMSFAVISLPMIYYGCKELGLWAALLWPTLTYLVQAIIGRIQLDKILREKATGIWNK